MDAWKITVVEKKALDGNVLELLMKSRADTSDEWLIHHPDKADGTNFQA